MILKCRPGDEERVAQEVSMDRLRGLLCKALTVKFEGAEGYIEDMYQSYLVYRMAGKTYKVGFSLVDDVVELVGEPEEVKQEWVRVSLDEMADEVFTILVRVTQAADPDGTAFEVIIAEPGFTKNGWYFPEDVLRDAADLFNGVDVNLYELPEKGATHVPDDLFDLKSLLVRNKAGWLENVRYVAGEGLKGVLHFLDSFKWLGKNILRAMQDGVRVYGLSLDAPTKAQKAVIEGRNVIKAVKMTAVDSVDIVTRPAAGGKFNRAVAAQTTEEIMDKQQLWDLITSKRADLLKGKEFEKVTVEDLTTIARMAMEPAQPGGGEGIAEINARIARMECARIMDNTLADSGLPVHAQNRIRSQFGERTFTGDELTRSIQAEKDYLAAIDAANADAGGATSGSRVRVGLGSYQKGQIALDKLFGLTQDDMVGFARMCTLEGVPFFEDRDFRGQPVIRSAQDFSDYNDVPQFRGIREAYTFFTGDVDVRGMMYRHRLPADMRSAQDLVSTTFTFALGNTMNRRLVRGYRLADWGTALLISIRKPVKDFRQQEAVLIGGYPDLADVDPEAADYQEIASVTDEEATYTIGQKGNILTIHRKFIINDDLNVILRQLDSFSRATGRTHGKYVWNLFINNGICSDGTAWFTGAGLHANLGAAALTHATAQAAHLALATTTEKDSGERLGLAQNVTLNLVGPENLRGAMSRIEKEEYYYTANDLTTKIPNPLQGLVKAHVITLMTDPNDWGLLMPPDQIDMIEMGYLNGREEPEFFVADSPQAEQVFLADKIRHKVRHEYAGTVIDFRSGYKAVVA